MTNALPIQNAVRILQNTNMARDRYAVEDLRTVVVDLLTIVSALQEFIEQNRRDPDFTNLALSSELVAALSGPVGESE